MDVATIGCVVGVIGCIVGLAGWLLNRDKHTEADAVWRGEVNGKLDVIVGIKADVSKITEECRENALKIARVDESTKSAHHRIDEMAREIHEQKEA